MKKLLFWSTFVFVLFLAGRSGQAAHLFEQVESSSLQFGYIPNIQPTPEALQKDLEAQARQAIARVYTLRVKERFGQEGYTVLPFEIDMQPPQRDANLRQIYEVQYSITVRIIVGDESTLFDNAQGEVKTIRDTQVQLIDPQSEITIATQSLELTQERLARFQRVSSESDVYSVRTLLKRNERYSFAAHMDDYIEKNPGSQFRMQVALAIENADSIFLSLGEVKPRHLKRASYLPAFGWYPRYNRWRNSEQCRRQLES